MILVNGGRVASRVLTMARVNDCFVKLAGSKAVKVGRVQSESVSHFLEEEAELLAPRETSFCHEDVFVRYQRDLKSLSPFCQMSQQILRFRQFCFQQSQKRNRGT